MIEVYPLKRLCIGRKRGIYGYCIFGEHTGIMYCDPRDGLYIPIGVGRPDVEAALDAAVRSGQTIHVHPLQTPFTPRPGDEELVNTWKQTGGNTHDTSND